MYAALCLIGPGPDNGVSNMRRGVEIEELAFDEEEAYRGSASFYEHSSSACDQNTSAPLAT
jgi:hypothetical protein